MNEQPDKWLDDLFRKSAEEFKPEFDRSDWDEMRKRLDDRDNSILLPWWKRMGKLWMWAGFLASIVVGGYFLNRFISSDEKPTGTRLDGAFNERYQTKQKILENRSRIEIGKKKKAETILSRSLPDVSGVRSGTVRSNSISGSGTSSLKGRKLKKNTGDREVAGSFPEGRKVLMRRGQKEGEVRPYFVDSTLKVGRTGVPEVKEIEIDPEYAWIKGEVEAVASLPPTFLNPPVKRYTIEVPVGVSFEETIKEPVESGRRWAVRIGLAPDLSTVGLKNFSAPRAAWNFLLEYRIVPRLFIQSGVARSLKVYKAGKEDYRLPEGVKQSVYPSSVNGQCTVLEVPVNVRYDFAVHERSNWFASIGVSSYQMLKEKYDYNYDKHYPGLKYGWSGETGWYWLSHLNASTGYEYKTGRNLSIIAEPYLRLPLKRVGYGKVNLITTGIWLSVRYTPAWSLK